MSKKALDPVNVIALASAPTLPTLSAGDQYFNTASNTVFTYTGSAWVGSASTANSLSQFAATTSAQLLGVMSDKTGTGSLVFGTAPTITTPKIVKTYTAKTAAYTFVSGDEGNIFSMNNAATQAFTVPVDATFNFGIGTEFNLFWITGAGHPTISAVTPGTTTVISTGATSATPKLRAANSMASILKIAANSWVVTGDIV